MKKIILLLVTVLLFTGMHSGSDAKASGIIQQDYSKYFAGYTGTFVLYDRSNDQYTIYNQQQSDKRLSPCSTFKIYNALIGLESGILDREDVYTLFKWNGTQYPFPHWNKDQTLASAISGSVVWYFQELASRVGSDRMQYYLDSLPYGNCDILGGITRFWLRSSLRISAKEQVDLLNRLYSGDIPFSQDNINVVKKDIVLANEDGVIFSGKTGSGYENGKWILGWFVGCVEKDGKSYFFATNIEANDNASGGKAREITTTILQDMGLLSK